jgi:HEAT repeat protein
MPGRDKDEEELDLRESLATGERLDEVILKASYDKDFLMDVIKYLDDDLWTVQKNAITVILSVLEDHEEIAEPFFRKLMVLIRKSEAIPLTIEIAKAIGRLSKLRPDVVRSSVPVLFANYRIGDPKIKVNMAYVIEEIMRQNPILLGNIVKEIAGMLSSPDETDRLAALNFIGALGENSSGFVTPFLPRLLVLLQDRNELIRAATVETLTKIAVSNPKFRKLIRTKLSEIDDQSELVMKTVMEGLTMISVAEAEEKKD